MTTLQTDPDKIMDAPNRPSQEKLHPKSIAELGPCIGPVRLRSGPIPHTAVFMRVADGELFAVNCFPPTRHWELKNPTPEASDEGDDTAEA